MLALLAACGNDAGTSTETSAVTTVQGQGDEALARALTCWGLTNRAYFMHQTVKDGGGNLPNPAQQVYRAWSNLAATTAHGAGMTLRDYEARQRAAQRAATVYSLDVKPDHAAAVQKCIDTAPVLGPDPELSWPD